jgi:ribonuclease III
LSRIDYTQPLIRQALTHRSAASGSVASYERLEWLGDALIGAVVTRALFDKNPTLPPGDLTLIRASIVNQATLADAARDLGLSEQLILGENERKLGRQNEPKLLSDAFEALVGALSLLSGSAVAEAFVLEQLAVKINAATPIKPIKSRLMESLQALGRGTPRYILSQNSAPLTVSVSVQDAAGQTLGVGSGRSQSEAETAAATDAQSKLDAG